MEAYDAKKWAFVSDYARFKILYEYGGVYFDTDVEILQSLDEVLKSGARGCPRAGARGCPRAGARGCPRAGAL